jgi:hypothetical protein
MANKEGLTLADLVRERSWDAGQGPLYMPDLTLWHRWHSEQGTLPERWQGCNLSQVARDMGVPAWRTVRPWRIETPGIETVIEEENEQRTTCWMLGSGTLTARWTLGPDGDWWQVEYPVKTLDDLHLLQELVASRVFLVHEDEVAHAGEEVGEDGLAVIELPQQPYSELLHAYLGWGEGLLLLSDGEALVSEILMAQQSSYDALLARLAPLPGEIVLASDNLDGNFISPPAFERYMCAGYSRTARILEEYGKSLIVQAGGPVRHLLPLLIGAGVEGVEGIAGPPQADLSLAEARQLVGPACTLWGGIPQDFTLATHDQRLLIEAIEGAVSHVRDDRRAIIGVADRVPVDADPDRLASLPDLIGDAWGRISRR